MYLKINKVTTIENGNADYKGIDLDLIVPGSQIYIKQPDGSMTAYVKTNQETIDSHADILIISAGDHAQADTEFKAAIPVSEDAVARQELQTRVGDIELALADLFTM